MTQENINILNTNPITNLSDTEYGGWYQPIEFPDGQKTFSKNNDFFERDSFGKRKWDKFIEPYILDGKSFLDIGCNAGIHIVLASKKVKKLYGVERKRQFYNQCRYVLK